MAVLLVIGELFILLGLWREAVEAHMEIKQSELAENNERNTFIKILRMHGICTHRKHVNNHFPYVHQANNS